MRCNTVRFAKSLVLIPLFAVLTLAQNAVTDWKNIAGRTIVGVGTPPGISGVYLAYVNLAMFDALNAIHPKFVPYGGIQPAASPDSSEAAAAATAAHDVLVNYFPAAAESLDPAYVGYMATLPDDSEAKNAGIAVGHAAALELVAQRAGDGVVGAVTYENGNGPGGLSGSTYVYGSEPGAYQKTPPAFLLAQTPWLATMTPFTMKSSSQFLPDEGPTPLDSEQWADDYNRTKRWGSLTDRPRTAEHTTIGLFWTANPGLGYTSMLGNLVQTYSLKALDSARLYAMTWSSAADAFIGCMNAKYHYNFWRPVTAIRAGQTDSNPKTVGDPSWTPLAVTPNHPEYLAAHGCVIAETIAGYFGTRKVSLQVTATYAVPAVLGGGSITASRSFSSSDDLLREVEAARIYGGMHFHHSIVRGLSSDIKWLVNS